MRFLAEIRKVGEPREYTKQDGTKGNAFPIHISTSLGYAAFEVYMSKEYLVKRGFVEGAAGYVEVTTQENTWTDSTGQSRVSTRLNIEPRSWELANQNIKQDMSINETIAEEVRKVRQESTQSEEGKKSKLPF